MRAFHPNEGRLAIATNAGWNAVDAICVARRATRMRTAKACGPGTPGLVLSLRGDSPRATVTNKVMDTGESTQKVVSHRAGNADVWLTCSGLTHVLLRLTHMRLWVRLKHPVFPAPSFLTEGGRCGTRACHAAGMRSRIFRHC